MNLCMVLDAGSWIGILTMETQKIMILILIIKSAKIRIKKAEYGRT